VATRGAATDAASRRPASQKGGFPANFVERNSASGRGTVTPPPRSQRPRLAAFRVAVPHNDPTEYPPVRATMLNDQCGVRAASRRGAAGAADSLSSYAGVWVKRGFSGVGAGRGTRGPQAARGGTGSGREGPGRSRAPWPATGAHPLEHGRADRLAVAATAPPAWIREATPSRDPSSHARCRRAHSSGAKALRLSVRDTRVRGREGWCYGSGTTVTTLVAATGHATGLPESRLPTWLPSVNVQAVSAAMADDGSKK
jgi:hypothetical protein